MGVNPWVFLPSSQFTKMSLHATRSCSCIPFSELFMFVKYISRVNPRESPGVLRDRPSGRELPITRIKPQLLGNAGRFLREGPQNAFF